MTRIGLLIALSLCAVSHSTAVEIRRWERMPLTIRLVVGQERVIVVDRNVRVGMPETLRERLRVQSAGGALYLRANAPIESTRLQVQDAETGALILLDVTAQPAVPDQPPLEPIRIIDGELTMSDHRAEHGETHERDRATPVPVVLTRYAAQSLYAPLRTIEPVNSIAPVSLRRNLALDTLLPTLPVQATALAAWRLDDHYVTAVKLTNTQARWIALDPRALQGSFLAAAFQHADLGPAGASTDTTVVYLVTRGHGLAEALLPAISSIDAAVTLRSSGVDGGDSHEE